LGDLESESEILQIEGKTKMTASRGFFILGCATLAMFAGAFCSPRSDAQDSGPKYEVDASWPKPLPERWVLGPVGAVCVDARDHVFILNRQGVLDVDLDAGQKAPPVIEFDNAGNVVNSWGQDAFDKDLVTNFHACHFDEDNNVWVLSTDSGITRKFSHDGSKLLLQIGKNDVVDSSDGTLKGKPLNSNTAQFFSAADINVDRKNGDIYVDDGDGAGNRRIAVMDRTGQFLRQWQPEDTKTIHCMALAYDGLMYLCNRAEGRLQVYDQMGNFKKNIEIPWKAYTPVAPGDEKRKSGGSGAAVAIALSRDANQRLMYVINQNDSEIEILDRQSGKVVSSFGRSGHFPGDFDQPLSIAVDSKGSVYVTENRGKRVQKFKIVN
jgi:DNA-binding beta-propeller fold protein YncE